MCSWSLWNAMTGNCTELNEKNGFMEVSKWVAFGNKQPFQMKPITEADFLRTKLANRWDTA